MITAEEKKICSRFIDAEKLSDLRTKQEIEAMSGHSSTRKLPPPPVLPPFGPLEKISGRLESFSSEYFREYFDADAYRTSTLPSVSDNQRGAGAALAIAAGSPGGGAAIMTKSESSNNSAEYVQGIINGKSFRGWVGMTRLQSGDEVEMVVEWQHDHYEVYAIALPDERIISLIPKCDMGRTAHAWWRIKNMLILAIILLLMFVIPGYIDSMLGGEWRAESGTSFFSEYYLLFIMAFGVFFLMAGLIAFSAYRACAPTRCKLAEEIFRLMGMNNASRINLNLTTKEKEQQLQKEDKWYDPGNENKPACPSSKFIYSSESWFYY
jgi:hypothetical protein